MIVKRVCVCVCVCVCEAQCPMLAKEFVRRKGGEGCGDIIIPFMLYLIVSASSNSCYRNNNDRSRKEHHMYVC